MHRLSSRAATALFRYDRSGIYEICSGSEKNPKRQEKSHDRRGHGYGENYRYEKPSDQKSFQRLSSEGGTCQAILGYPEVIILDEPTVGLDPKQIIEIRDLIKSLKKKHTVILSSHILSEVSAICDYVLIISHGKLVASDTPDNLGKLAAGSNNLNLLVKGEKSRIRQLLEEISGVKEISIEKKSDQEGWNVTVSTEENADIREEVFFKMAENHCPILEMQSQKISLEEIFLELTEDNKKDSSDTDNRIQTAEEAEAVIRESENMTEEADKHDSSL